MTQRRGKYLDWLVKSDVCPGLFYGTPAADGFLVRLRIPGGLLDQQQVRTIATILNHWDQPTLQVTNRGNLQLRGITTAPTPEMFQALQAVGLAAQNPQIDRLRNFMVSPTAGIDPQELLDPRPYLWAIDSYLQNHPELAALPSKFSIGIDSGGVVGIGMRSPERCGAKSPERWVAKSPLAWEHRYNEIQLSAVTIKDQIYFHLALGGDKQLLDTQVVLKSADCVSVIGALATVYLEYSQQAPPRQQRMKHLLEDWGLEAYLERVNQLLPTPLRRREKLALSPTIPYSYWGVHPQRQEQFSYVGINLPLGKLTAAQWISLGQLSTTFGNGELRLSPWQSVIVPYVPSDQAPELLRHLEDLGLSASATRPDAAIVACAGKPGCAASATHTQAHALTLGDELIKCQIYDSTLAPLSRSGRGVGGEGFSLTPVNIHLTGCAKSCAQASPAEITLLGRAIERDGVMIEGYDVYVGNGQQSCAQQIYQGTFAEILPLMPQILQRYQGQTA